MAVSELPISDAPDEARASSTFRQWLRSFAAAVGEADVDQLASHFVADPHWRDLLSLDWEYRTVSGQTEIAEGLLGSRMAIKADTIRPATKRIAPRLVKRAGAMMVEAYFEFDTSIGVSNGFVRLLAEPEGGGEPAAWLLLTALQDLHGFEETVEDRRPSGIRWSRSFAGENWLDERTRVRTHAGSDPDVLIIGGGQAGLILAARLGQIGVDAVIAERNERVGDNWRNRYHSLTLHNEVWANSMPYVPFPPTWPTFVPKDKLAGFLEAYAELLELNIWTGTELTAASYDADAERWVATLRGPDGERTVRVPHLVLASGTVSGAPRRPRLPGLDSFAGEVMHSSDFSSGVRYRGRRAIVIGTGNSGHDVTQDLFENGAESVTLVQRSPTCVVSLVPSGTLVYSLYSEGPVEDIDLITASIPYPVLKDAYQHLTRRTKQLDSDLLEGLTSAGFRLDFEPDDTGFHMRYLRTGGGYYINVGCSDLIIEGKVGLAHADQIDTFTATGMRMSDGSEIAADLVVLATGYENQSDTVGRLFGADVANAVGPIWGFDEHGFMRGMWRRTGVDRFWIMGGALNECRLYSRFLALQIKASLEGLLPE